MTLCSLVYFGTLMNAMTGGGILVVRTTENFKDQKLM